MAATFAFDPRHQIGQNDCAPGRSAVVELPVMRRRAEGGFASITEKRPTFGASALDRRNTRSSHLVILSPFVCARIQYGNAPVNLVAAILVDRLQSLMEDRLTRSPGSVDELQLQILGQIRDNLSTINRKQDAIDAKVTSVSERVVRLEERDERLERAEKSIEKMDGKLDALLRDKDQRDGAGRVFVGIRGWTPVIIAILSALASIVTAIYVIGRAANVIEPSRSIRAEVMHQSSGEAR